MSKEMEVTLYRKSNSNNQEVGTEIKTGTPLLNKKMEESLCNANQIIKKEVIKSILLLHISKIVNSIIIGSSINLKTTCEEILPDLDILGKDTFLFKSLLFNNITFVSILSLNITGKDNTEIINNNINYFDQLLNQMYNILNN